MNNTTKYIVTPVVVGSLALSGYGYIKIKHLENENSKLKTEIEQSSMEKNKKVTLDVTIEDIHEINKNNVDLVVFETDATEYKIERNENSLLGINAQIKTKFKYLVTIDMSRAKTYTTAEKIIVQVDSRDIKLKEIIIDEPEITYETNMITNMRGKHILEIEKYLITKLYDGIDETVKKDFTDNNQTFKLNLIEKLNNIYNSSNVNVVVN